MYLKCDLFYFCKSKERIIVNISPEVNDVDISKLFEWRAEVIINDINDNPTKLYMRLVGDAELNMARVAGLRASAELRRKFKDTNSDEYIAYIPDLEDIEKRNLIEFLVMLRMAAYREDASDKVRIPFPKEPKADDSLEKKENYQLRLDNYPTERENKVKIELDKIVKKEKAAMNRKSKEVMMEEYKKTLIDQMCESKMNSVFIGHSIFFGTYKDSEFKNKLFNSFKQFENLPIFAKEQFVEKYIDLQLGISDLKK